MTPEEFRVHGHALVDWIAGYLEGIEDQPVAAAVAPGDVRGALPAHPPRTADSFEAVMADVDRVIVPGLTSWQHPSFFAYFPSNTSYASILGELLSAGLGVNGMLWATSPAATELETLMLDWMGELLALPECFRSAGPGGGVIQGTASEATLCAILAARQRAGDGELVAYSTAQAHSSVEKGLRIAGIDVDHLRHVEVDDTFAMRPDALAQDIQADRAAGRLPFLVVATRGTTSSMAFDPVAAIGPICRAEGLWLHVDAAMAGIAALCPELRWVNDGLELADSYCTNPHKWMGVNFDCDLMWVADRAPLLAALSILPEYLRTAAADAGAVIDYRDWQVPLGRRFRALKLWFVLRLDGIEPVRTMIRHHLALTDGLVQRVAADRRFVLAAPPALNLVCLRHAAGDEATDQLVAVVNRTGAALLTRTVLDGRSVLRVCIGNRTTEGRHVEALWQLLSDLAPAV
jgi:aromatic-L-amino-acid/L-tryptophan decarboxylase